MFKLAWGENVISNEAVRKSFAAFRSKICSLEGAERFRTPRKTLDEENENLLDENPAQT